MEVFGNLFYGLYYKPKIKEETLIASKIPIISKNNITINKNEEITITGSGKFYRGEYKGEPVSIKSVDITKDDSIINEFLLWQFYSNSPYTLTMLGVCLNGWEAYIVFQNFQYTLETYLQYNKLLKDENRIKITRQVLNILNVFQKKNQNILDIRPGIFAVTDTMEIKILDFGLLINQTNMQNESAIVSKRLRYMPPEMFSENENEISIVNNYNNYCDIWSFGCLLIDIFSKTNSVMNSNFEDDDIKVNIIQGDFPKIPSDINCLLIDIIKRCLYKDVTSRINFDELYINLNIFLDNFSENNDTEFSNENSNNDLLENENYAYIKIIENEINTINNLINFQLYDNVQSLKKNISLFLEENKTKINISYDNIINFIQQIRKNNLTLLEQFKNKILMNILIMQDYYSNTLVDMVDIQNKISEIKLNITTLNKFTNKEKYLTLISSIENGKKEIEHVVKKYTDNTRFDKITSAFESNQTSVEMYQQFAEHCSTLFSNLYLNIKESNSYSKAIRKELIHKLEMEKELKDITNTLIEVNNIDMLYFKIKENSNSLIAYDIKNENKINIHLQNENNNKIQFNSNTYSLYDYDNKILYISGGTIPNTKSESNSFYKITFSNKFQPQQHRTPSFIPEIELNYYTQVHQLSNMSVARSHHSLLQLKSNSSILIAIGGLFTNTCEAYNTSLDIWKDLPNLPTIVVKPTCFEYGDYIYVFNGNENCIYRCDIITEDEIKWDIIQVKGEKILKGMCVIINEKNEIQLLGGMNVDGEPSDEIYKTMFEDEVVIEKEKSILPRKSIFNSNVVGLYISDVDFVYVSGDMNDGMVKFNVTSGMFDYVI